MVISWRLKNWFLSEIEILMVVRMEKYGMDWDML